MSVFWCTLLHCVQYNTILCSVVRDGRNSFTLSRRFNLDYCKRWFSWNCTSLRGYRTVVCSHSIPVFTCHVAHALISLHKNQGVQHGTCTAPSLGPSCSSSSLWLSICTRAFSPFVTSLHITSHLNHDEATAWKAGWVTDRKVISGWAAESWSVENAAQYGRIQYLNI